MEADNILEQIHIAGLKFLLPLTLEETYKIIVAEAVSLVNAAYGSIMLDVDGQLKRVYSSSKLGYGTSNRKNGNTYSSFSEKKIIVAHIDETGKFHPELVKQGIKSTIFIPLAYQDKTLGVLTINSKEKIEQSTSELKALKLFGSMATLVIRKAQLYNIY